MMEPTLDEAISALFRLARTPAAADCNRGSTTKLNSDQIRIQLGDAQKALDSLKHLLNEPVVSTSSPKK